MHPNKPPPETLLQMVDYLLLVSSSTITRATQ